MNTIILWGKDGGNLVPTNVIRFDDRVHFLSSERPSHIYLAGELEDRKPLLELIRRIENGTEKAVVRDEKKPGVSRDKTEAEWKDVATIGSIDRITGTHVTNLLKAKGIECAMGGSIVYGVSVPKQHAEAATRLLREDAKKRGYWIKFGEKDDPKVAEVTPTQIRLPIAQALTRPEFAKDKPLGRFLRSKELSAKLRDYPFVESLQIREREYLASKDKTEIGYEVRITLHAKAGDDSKGCRFGYQVLSQGLYIESQGGSEWSKGSPK